VQSQPARKKTDMVLEKLLMVRLLACLQLQRNNIVSCLAPTSVGPSPLYKAMAPSVRAMVVMALMAPG
jgi:hypothetical protein